MLGIYISIFIILANILFICAIYSCIKVDTHKHTLCSIQLLSVLSVNLFFFSPAALSSCNANCFQEDCSVSHQQHPGWSIQHYPRLHLCLCEYGRWMKIISSHFQQGPTSSCYMLTVPVLSSALPKFACDTKSLAQCVAEKRNTSAALVTPCLIRSLNVSVEGGLEICPSQGPSCPFPEVRIKKSFQILTMPPDLLVLQFLLVTITLPSAPVF